MGSPARLEVVSGKAIGMSVLVDDELLIGRHTEGAGRLADDDEISRSHARVTVDDSGFCAIEDLGSRNGTFVNGVRISAPQTLSVGDRIELGASTLVVRELPTPAGVQAMGPAGQRPTVVPGPDQAGAALEEHLAAPPPLALQLEVDFVSHAARITFDESSEPAPLVLEDGVWRLSSPGA
jgi:predicted component of type VI protein secretion system